jgi:hypothetical protein
MSQTGPPTPEELKAALKALNKRGKKGRETA